LGTRTLFTLAAQEREQNFGFRVSRVQLGHTAMGILSKGLRGKAGKEYRFPPCPVNRLCRDCTATA